MFIMGHMILGVDEVGRGPWAGPLVVGAVVLGCEIEGLTDSKKLSAKRREELNEEILRNASAVGLGWVSASEIDEAGLSDALKLATKRAVKQIKTPFHEIIIDGTVNFLTDTPLASHVTTIKKADLLIPSVSAASIVAKVARDKYMAEQSDAYPEYGFASHVGYGTAKHVAAIKKYGVTTEHRLSFAPLRKYQKQELNSKTLNEKTKTATTKSIGDLGENAAAAELVRQGHKILDRNWKTKMCEIDIVSRKNDTVYFVEVKHRKTSKHGDGLAAVTSKKVQKMTFAAKVYIKMHQLNDVDVRLVAIGTTGNDPLVDSFVEILD